MSITKTGIAQSMQKGPFGTKLRGKLNGVPSNDPARIQLKNCCQNTFFKDLPAQNLKKPMAFFFAV
jgi:hypothetical protein